MKSPCDVPVEDSWPTMKTPRRHFHCPHHQYVIDPGCCRFDSTPWNLDGRTWNPRKDHNVLALREIVLTTCGEKRLACELYYAQTPETRIASVLLQLSGLMREIWKTQPSTPQRPLKIPPPLFRKRNLFDQNKNSKTKQISHLDDCREVLR